MQFKKKIFIYALSSLSWWRLLLLLATCIPKISPFFKVGIWKMKKRKDGGKIHTNVNRFLKLVYEVCDSWKMTCVDSLLKILQRKYMKWKLQFCVEKQNAQCCFSFLLCSRAQHCCQLLYPVHNKVFEPTKQSLSKTWSIVSQKPVFRQVVRHTEFSALMLVFTKKILVIFVIASSITFLVVPSIWDKEWDVHYRAGELSKPLIATFTLASGR